MKSKKTLGEALNELDIAKTEFMKAFCKGIGIYKVMEFFNMPVKDKYKL